MKRRLLKAPAKNNEIVFLPDAGDLLAAVNENTRIATAHQPHFFHPGVSLKFLFIDQLPLKNKNILFLDTDRANITVNIPSQAGVFYQKIFINSDKTLHDYPAPEKRELSDFFSSLEESIGRRAQPYAGGILPNVRRFKKIILGEKRDLLKEVLAEGFLDYYGIRRDYAFVSDIAKTDLFRDFFAKIYKDDSRYRKIFNKALSDYKKEFRFRYKNFPFPRLKAEELPFWIVRDGKRQSCFKKDIELSRVKNELIFPRASTLTLFLRLYKSDCFVHGIGGANYEWVQDRVIEGFFKQSPPLYAVISGTFFIGDSNERELPYFFYDPQRIRGRIDEFMREKMITLAISGKKGVQYRPEQAD